MTRNGTTITMTIEELAYIGEVSRQFGYAQAEADMAEAWAVMSRRLRKTLRQPTFEQLQHRRYNSGDTRVSPDLAEAAA